MADSAFDGYKGHFGSAARDLFILDLADVFHFVHQFNIKMGWWSDITTGAPKVRNTGEILMLMVSELAEAMEGDRKGAMDDKLPNRPQYLVELGDAHIRAFDTSGAKRIGKGQLTQGTWEDARLQATILAEKFEFNFTRVDHQRAARLSPDGKAY